MEGNQNQRAVREARKHLATSHAAEWRHDEAIRKGLLGAFYDVLRRRVDTDDQPQTRKRGPKAT